MSASRWADCSTAGAQLGEAAVRRWRGCSIREGRLAPAAMESPFAAKASRVRCRSGAPRRRRYAESWCRWVGLGRVGNLRCCIPGHDAGLVVLDIFEWEHAVVGSAGIETWTRTNQERCPASTIRLRRPPSARRKTPVAAADRAGCGAYCGLPPTNPGPGCAGGCHGRRAGVAGRHGVRGASRTVTGERSVRAAAARGCLRGARLGTHAHRRPRGSDRRDGRRRLDPHDPRSRRASLTGCPTGPAGRRCLPRRPARPAGVDRRLPLPPRADRLHPWRRVGHDRQPGGQAARPQTSAPRLHRVRSSRSSRRSAS